jgi:hypothetical protein
MNYVTTSRRGFLRASGVCLALPWLESLASAAEAAAPPHRAVFVFVPNGVNMWQFHPVKIGRDYELTPTLKPLAAVRNRMTIFSGLQHLKVKGGHEEWAHLFTGNVNSNVASKHTVVNSNTISIDQHIAEVLGPQTRWPSMVVGADGGRMTSSFNRKGEPVLADFDLKNIFDELVGADPRGRLGSRASILDLVTEQATALRGQLGKSDERKLDEYLESVRGLEKRLKADLTAKKSPKGAIDEERLSLNADPYNGKQQHDYVDTMFELIFLALQTDSTRVVTFTSTRSEGGGPLKALGGDWHGEGHNTKDLVENAEPKAFGVLAAFDIWWHERLARFLERLRSASEGGKDLLHNTAVFFGRGMSWPAMHRSDNLPLILAGGEGMGFVQGRHVAFNGQTPVVAVEGKAPPIRKDLGLNPASVSDLLRTISERMNVPAQGFGESRRVLDELVV